MALTVVGSKAVIRVLLFIVVVPIAWGGGGCVVSVLWSGFSALYSLSIILPRDHCLLCFTCKVALCVRGAVGWSAVCDCGIIRSYSL